MFSVAVVLLSVGQVCTIYSLAPVCPAVKQPFADSFVSQPAPSNDTVPATCGGSIFCKSALTQWQQARILAAHNAYRAYNGACPLVWDDDAAAWTLASLGFMEMCSAGDASQGNTAEELAAQNYSEATAALGESPENLLEVDVARAPFMWYCLEEACFRYSDVATAQPKTLAFTRLVWQATTSLGCAVCQKNVLGAVSVYVMCNYKTGGNVAGAFAQNVAASGTQAEGCTAQTEVPQLLTEAPLTEVPAQGAHTATPEGPSQGTSAPQATSGPFASDSPDAASLSSSPGASAVPAPAHITASPHDAGSDSDSDSGTHIGIIVAAAAGALLLLAVVLGAVWFCMRQRSDALDTAVSTPFREGDVQMLDAD